MRIISGKVLDPMWAINTQFTCQLTGMSQDFTPPLTLPRRLPGLHSPYVTRKSRKPREYPWISAWDT
jgi:hypothetical protein